MYLRFKRNARAVRRQTRAYTYTRPRVVHEYGGCGGGGGGDDSFFLLRIILQQYNVHYNIIIIIIIIRRVGCATSSTRRDTHSAVTKVVGILFLKRSSPNDSNAHVHRNDTRAYAYYDGLGESGLRTNEAHT